MHQSLIKIQHRLKAPKGQKNSFGNYNYRSCEDILEALKPLLYEEEVYINISDEIISVLDRVYIKATASLKDNKGNTIEQSTGLAREAMNRKGQDESQITGAASSYARKYALNGLFAIDDTKDADTDEHQNNQQEAEKKQAQQRLKKAEEWTKEYISKLQALEDCDRDLIPLQTENSAMLQRISNGYPELHKLIVEETNRIRSE
jgi:hypothetical protein